MARLDVRASFFGGHGFLLYHAWGENSATCYRPHFHDEYLIGCQLQGYEDFEVSGKLERFAAGDLVLINPHQVHTGNIHANQGLEYINLYVDRDFAHAVNEEVNSSPQEPEFTVVKSQDHLALGCELLALRDLIAKQATERENNPTRHSQAIDKVSNSGERGVDGVKTAQASSKSMSLDLETALYSIVGRVMGHYSNTIQPRTLATNRIRHRKIARVVECLRDQYASHHEYSPNLDELASIAELSKYHFLRQFKVSVGMTPGAYLRTLKICKAAQLLRKAEQPIIDVALLVGFADHPSFSRAFSRVIGMTPSEYQRLRRHASASSSRQQEGGI